jgi:hypothetical protein
MSTSSIRFFFWIYLLFLVWAAATVTNPADPDLWHRLAVGEYLWQTGHFPLGDTFSYLFDYKQVADHEWGGALIFYGLWQWGGGAAIVAAKLVTLAVTLALVVWAGMRDRRPTASLAAFYALVLLALLPSFQSTVRCMVFTHIFFALWLFWFQCERHGRPVPTLSLRRDHDRLGQSPRRLCDRAGVAACRDRDRTYIPRILGKMGRPPGALLARHSHQSLWRAALDRHRTRLAYDSARLW